MKLRVFISLTHRDHTIAVALGKIFEELFGEYVEVSFSTKKEVNGGIRAGDDWFNWIVTQVKHCHFALIVISPTSIGTEWILWEAGAVFGAASASDDEWLRKVRPLLFRVDPDEIPRPIRESKAHAKHGDDFDDMMSLLTDIALTHDWESAEESRLKRKLPAMHGMVSRYLETVQKFLRIPRKDSAASRGDSLLGGVLNVLTAPQLLREIETLRDEVRQNSRALAALMDRVQLLTGTVAAPGDGAGAVERLLSEIRTRVAARGHTLVITEESKVQLGTLLTDHAQAAAVRRSLDLRISEHLDGGADGANPAGGTVTLVVASGNVDTAFAPPPTR